MKIPAFLLIFLVFLSCKSKLDIFAPGKETISVYGILNINEPVQNIRINKVYITEGDAMVAAKDNSQINFDEGELTVTLERFVNGSSVPAPTTVGNSIKKKITLTETVVTTKPGIFGTSQRLWQTTDRLFGTGDYKLTITNNVTGTVYTSRTSMVDSVKSVGEKQKMPFLYVPNAPDAYPVHGHYPKSPQTSDKPKYLNYVTMKDVHTVGFYTVPNARLYDVTIRFHYIDSSRFRTATANYVDYHFFPNKVSTISGGQVMDKFSFSVQEFYENLAYELSKKDNPDVTKRLASHVEFIIDAGSDDLATFIQVNEPSNTIAQDKPNYTNIEGGYGIFSSRSTSRLSKDLWGSFIDQLACDKRTNPYRFCNYFNYLVLDVCE